MNVCRRGKIHTMDGREREIAGYYAMSRKEAKKRKMKTKLSIRNVQAERYMLDIYVLDYFE